MSREDGAPAAVGDGDRRVSRVDNRPMLGGGTREALRGDSSAVLASGGSKG
jgi:hypothetical protein